MSNEIKIAAQSRTEFGKGASRRLRREDLVPAVMYGHGSDPVHLTMPGHDTLLALRTANALLSISIDGGEPQLALPRQVQRNPLKGTLTHVDLLVVKRGEKVVVEVPLVIIGEEDLDEGIVMADMMSIELEVEATRIPANIEINVAGWEVGRQLTAGELELPEGAAYTGEDEDLVLSINVVREEAAEPEEGEEERPPRPAPGRPRKTPSRCHRRGSWSGSAIRARPTPPLGTTSATWWSTRWCGVPGAGTRLPARCERTSARPASPPAGWAGWVRTPTA